ncbi:phosphotransferase family protein [Ktedonobacter racemifer]|uniref:Aminoglycoside phosphotransferase n=1 Tax=Ktedonobacter racemifer DSM 44963 TaxID=485913 RepID=D6TP58_KTERA|nr:phosphotransferase [Ktedonobacter racemifer]EFH87414.1 aminoglycoside phosphotransferase [Ktedonobacter racemifer DSM 44963]
MTIQQEIFSILGIKGPVLLGEGSESQTYDYTADKVVKIYKGPVEQDNLDHLCSIYTWLSTHHLPFAVPEIYAIESHEGTVYLIEKKLAGRPISAVYAQLQMYERQRLLSNYLEAVRHLQGVVLPTQPYGSIFHAPGPSPVPYQSWRKFLRETAPLKLPQTQDDLRQEGIDVARLLEKFFQDIENAPDTPEKNFVHGDYFFGNVLVDDELEISAVLDVSWWSVVGDHLMDIAGAVMFLDLYEYVTPQEIASLTQQALALYGPEILTAIRIYGVYYSLLLSDCKLLDPAAYSWSIKRLREYMQ